MANTRDIARDIKSYLKNRPSSTVSSAISALGLGLWYNQMKNRKALEKYIGKKTNIKKPDRETVAYTAHDLADAWADL